MPLAAPHLKFWSLPTAFAYEVLQSKKIRSSSRRSTDKGPEGARASWRNSRETMSSREGPVSRFSGRKTRVHTPQSHPDASVSLSRKKKHRPSFGVTNLKRKLPTIPGEHATVRPEFAMRGCVQASTPSDCKRACVVRVLIPRTLAMLDGVQAIRVLSPNRVAVNRCGSARVQVGRGTCLAHTGPTQLRVAFR